MSSPVVFAITRAQAELLDAITRPGFKPFRRHRQLKVLEARYLVQQVKGRWTLTTPGCVVQELVRMISLHRDGADTH